MAPKTRVKVNVDLTRDALPQLMKAMRALERREVVVGFPEDKNKPRKDGDPMTNAAIAYTLDKGDPERNLPPRPFLEEGVIEAKLEIVKRMKDAGTEALESNPSGVEKNLTAAGVGAVSGVRNKITTGPFEGLSKRTLAARRRRGITRTDPLKDTMQMNNAVNFTIRDRRK